MGRAGKALKQVLESYDITQNRLAVEMGIGRSNVHRWINELADPVGDAIIDIRDALEKINPVAAEAFTTLYWNSSPEDSDSSAG
ncbi:MAG: helix-turn-helix transcriptional regulator [Leptolyngbyaceae cyanobacterium SM1_3_5]|nr:helix-turn-helix transcriptional regulator [Leptolyngbyaceae cyanobacterium SM1_3_5]